MSVDIWLSPPLVVQGLRLWVTILSTTSLLYSILADSDGTGLVHACHDCIPREAEKVSRRARHYHRPISDAYACRLGQSSLPPCYCQGSPLVENCRPCRWVVHSTKGSEIDIELNGREPGILHLTTQVSPSNCATSFVSDACTCRMTGMKDISFPKARGVSPTYGMGDKTDLIRSKLTVVLDLSIMIIWSMCISSMSIGCFGVILGFIQGEDADDFNPDRFLGNLPGDLAADTKDSASIFLYMTSLLRTFWFAYYRRWSFYFIFYFRGPVLSFMVYRAHIICKFSTPHHRPS